MVLTTPFLHSTYKKLPSHTEHCISRQHSVRARNRPLKALAYTASDDLAVKLSLLKKIATLNRGALATGIDRNEVQKFAAILEKGRGLNPFTGSPSPVEGTWELMYSEVEAFRSSPFFWAFQEGVVRDRALADQIFQFTSSIPGTQIGPAIQKISLLTGVLVSEVELVLFPGIKGLVVTTSKLEPLSSSVLGVTVENTRVLNSTLSTLLDNVVVPVQEILEQLVAIGATKVTVEVTYVDEEIRLSRTRPDGHLFVYRKVTSI